MTAIEMIAEKVRTNIEHKGYTAEHDDTHTKGELLDAAECYIEHAAIQSHIGDIDILHVAGISTRWPFEKEAWKPSDDPIRNLVHAGALIAAEIDRLKRAYEATS